MNDEKNILKNRWNNLKRIGGTGITTTYSAIDKTTGRPCIVKKFSLLNAGSWKAAELFEREAKTLKHLDHSNIPRYIDYFTEDEIHYYIVQEYAQGKSLAAWIADGRHFTEQETISIAVSIAETLNYLHRFSPPIIHRDIKPQNIILGRDNKMYLIDFGAVWDRLKGDFDSTVTGTFGYMAPEQTRGKTIPGSDIYSLGVTLIHILSHIPPYEMEEKEMRLQFHPHVNISGAFVRILEKMTEPHIEKRYTDIQKLLSDLYAVGQEEHDDSLFPDKNRQSLSWMIIIFFFIIAGMTIMQFLIHKKTDPAGPAHETPEETNEPSRPRPVAEDGLIAYFPFDGNTRDESGNNHIASVYGNLEYVPGVIGKAADFDGRTTFLSVEPPILLPHDLTITAWVMLRKNLEPNSAYTVFSIRDRCPASWRGWSQVNFRIFRFEHVDCLSYSVDKTDSCRRGSAGDRYVSQEINFAQNLHQWIFIAVTVESNASEHRRVNLYVNDKEVIADVILNVSTKTAFDPSRKYKTFIGSLDSKLLNFNGYLEDLRIYDRALSDKDILDIFAVSSY